MASKMIGKSVKVIGGQNKGLVGWIVSDNVARGQYIINVAGPTLGSSGFKISAKYRFVEVNEPIDTALVTAKSKFEGKPVSVDLHNALENSSGKKINGMGAWVSLVYRDEDTDQIVANVVFMGEYAVVPVDDIGYVMSYGNRPGRA
ncbi:MotB-like transcriptional regulator [Cronobacter phage Pet-CM3-4]|uniref:Uncharacterized protein n=1 Tax=Cronobacter phage Pet-CM3-4 TaxID=1892569 RepID=A0A1D3RKD6_9CAUD|nr:MotB-like transcriptional regulator [Cronobacter phage Pet-CM3-4]SCN45705.1 hypothetical protein [Cronobacter phage Pet-CM3-4]